MRVSRFGLLKLGAVLTVLSALPCLGQSQLTLTMASANHASKLSVPGVQLKVQEQSQQQSKKQLQKAQKQLRQLQKKLTAEVNRQIYELKMSHAAAGQTQLAQRECFTMRVFSYPKGFPDKDATALPKVSDCTPASRFHERGLVQGVQIFQTKKQR